MDAKFYVYGFSAKGYCDSGKCSATGTLKPFTSTPTEAAFVASEKVIRLMQGMYPGWTGHQKRQQP